MPDEKMTVKEYARMRNITPGAVHKALRKGHKTPGIVNFDMYGGTYILYVDKKFLRGIIKNTIS